MSEPVVVNRLKFVNSWLVAEEDGLTLIDANIGGTAGRILAAAERLGAPIVRIVLTHAHPDHVGSLDALAERLPGVPVLISARDARLLAGDASRDPHEPEGRLRGMKVKTAATGHLAPGERVGSLEVVPSPGHTPGHVALLDTRDRTLYCGDAFSTYLRVATSAEGRSRTPLPSMATWHKPTALASARALRALDPARLAPGHGRVVEAPGAAMDAALARVS
jgi:glyoxylase-like metal-dependent hydrolase (beta-lactamase superfamily II)